MKTILQSLRLLAALTLLTGVIYPVIVSAVARLVFPDITRHHLLLAQKTEGAGYFWPRPSAADYATVPSGASNQGPASAALAEEIAKRRARLGPGAPDELVTASGSGLDPHLSPVGARFQAPRIAAARQLPLERVLALIEAATEGPQFGFLGEPRVNVLALNRALDGAR